MSDIQEDIPQLGLDYCRGRSQTVISAGLIILWAFGVKFEGVLPLLGVNVEDPTIIPNILSWILAYSVLHLVLGWFHSHPSRRRFPAARIDLAVTLTIALAAILALVGPELRPPFIALFSLVSSVSIWGVLSVVFLGIATGELASIFVLGFFFIRSKEEAQRFALPRVPVAIRASFRLAYVVLPAVITLLCLSPSLVSPMSDLWPWLFVVPALFVFLAGTAALLPPSSLKELRKAFDIHDGAYQIGGWDTPIKHHHTELFMAAKRGDTEGVRQLLQEGFDPNKIEALGWTALMIAVAEQHEDTATILLDSGANPNIANLSGRSALMFAARYGNRELVSLLIRHGAQVDLNESSDPNALAVAARGGHREVVKLLLDTGADPAVRDDRGRTAESYAVAAGQTEIAELLRETQAERNG